jgi:multimeric flavodoxin WrbA
MEKILKEEIDRIRKMMLSEDNVKGDGVDKLKETIDILKSKKRVLLLSCSNRYNWDENKIDVPKSKILGEFLVDELGRDKVNLVDVSKLKIFPCEGNVSRSEGNSCGIKKSALKDDDKNPTGHHRCWASINNKSDELWKISKELFESDCVIFLASVRWGSANMFYQNLIERLTWLQNRHSTLGESNILKDIESGMICVGHNFNGSNVTDLQSKIHEFYGFKVNKKLYWNWQYTNDVHEETPKSYKDSYKSFIKDFGLEDEVKS